MATSTKTTPDPTAAFEQLIELNERFVTAGKRVGNVYVDGCEKLLEGVTTYQQTLAAQSHNDAVESMIGTQLDVTRQLVSAYTSAARAILA